MDWILLALLSYLLLGALSIADKWLLSDRIPDPASYAFYSGVFGTGIFLLIPFVRFAVPDGAGLWSALGSGFFFIFFLFVLYRGLKRFDPSRVVPAIGGMAPFFTLGIITLLFGARAALPAQAVLALALLAAGTAAISSEPAKRFSPAVFWHAALAALLLALHMGFIKKAFVLVPFWHTLIILGAGAGAASLLLLAFSKPLRRELRSTHGILQNGTPWYFAGIRAAGGLAGFLQRAAVFLAPAAGIPFINALQGTQYVFILLIIWGAALAGKPLWKAQLALPSSSVLQRAGAVALISSGLALLAFTPPL